MDVYPDDVKARALELYRTKGPTAAGKAVGVDKRTVASWAKKAGVTCEATSRTTAATEAMAARWAARRAEMVDEIGKAAEEALAKTNDALKANQARPAQAFATTMAILIDKAQLLDGGATARHDHVDPAAIVDGARARVVSLVERRENRTGS